MVSMYLARLMLAPINLLFKEAMSGNAGFDTCLFHGGGWSGAFHDESPGLDEAVPSKMSHHLLPPRRIHCASDTYEVWAADALTELCRTG